ncbi:MAG TPA: ATP-binding protein [Bacteroidales bacterium]|nr:ATP-binding protein [Bacteroidales bacterium]
MIQREIGNVLVKMAEKMPVISITGPRQSGKTTLARMCFPEYDYVNLENPDMYEAAKDDPRLFLSQFKKGIIIDEVQRLPSLFSYIQTISDERNKPGEFILTGSENFLLSEKISQSLAGRVFVSHLLPLSISELERADLVKTEDMDATLFHGFYPRIHKMDIEPEMFFPSYIHTYVERDVRQIVNVSNLFLFQKFLRIAAGRIGKFLNYSSIANELGVDLKTVKSWFSILESSFIVFFLHPHYQNFSKRITKAPKLYFYDTGLICSLLGIRKKEELTSHWSKGALFENMIIADLMKGFLNQGKRPSLYFWRDSAGNEIDCLIDTGSEIKCVEIKSGTTISSDFFKGLKYYRKLNPKAAPFLIYGGTANSIQSNATIFGWRNAVESLLKQV